MQPERIQHMRDLLHHILYFQGYSMDDVSKWTGLSKACLYNYKKDPTLKKRKHVEKVISALEKRVPKKAKVGTPPSKYELKRELSLLIQTICLELGWTVKQLEYESGLDRDLHAYKMMNRFPRDYAYVVECLLDTYEYELQRRERKRASAK